MKPQHLNYLALALLTLIWGTTWAAIRIGLTGIPPFTGAALRFGIASAVLLVAALAAGIRLGRSRRERWLWVGNGLFTFAGSYGVVYWAEQYVPSGLASVIFATFTLFVALLGHFFLPGDRLSRPATVGVLVGFVGVAILFSEDLARLGGPEVGVAATVFLASPLLAAIGQVMVKRWGQGLHPVSLTAVPMALTAGILGGLGWLLERDRPLSLTPAAVGSVIYLGLVGTALAFSLYFWLLLRIQATRAALIAYLAPVVALLVGVGLLGEPFTGRLLAGAATVLVGVVLTLRS